MVSQLLSLNYYFNPAPTTYVNRKELVIIFASILLISGIILYFYRQKYISDKKIKKILRPYPGKLVKYGLIAFLLLSFRLTGLPYLAMRIWWIILFLFMVYNLIKFIKVWLKKDKGFQPKERKIDHNDKYLPKKKKKH